MKLQTLSKPLASEANVFETVAADVIKIVSNAAAKAAFDGNAKLTAKSGTVDVLIDKRQLLDVLTAEAQMPATLASEVLEALVRIAAVI